MLSNDLKKIVHDIYDGDMFYGESIEKFEKTMLVLFEYLTEILNLSGIGFNLKSFIENFEAECDLKIQSDLAYQANLKENAINLMNPEDQDDPEMIKLMLEGKYF